MQKELQTFKRGASAFSKLCNAFTSVVSCFLLFVSSLLRQSVTQNEAMVALLLLKSIVVKMLVTYSQRSQFH